MYNRAIDVEISTIVFCGGDNFAKKVLYFDFVIKFENFINKVLTSTICCARITIAL